MRIDSICLYIENHGEREDGKSDGDHVAEINSPFLVTAVKESGDGSKESPKVTLTSGWIFPRDGGDIAFVEDVPPIAGAGHKDGRPGYAG